MNKTVDILTVDCSAIDSYILKYTKENDKLPYGLLVDNITVWDLVLHITNGRDAMGVRMVRDGIEVFKSEKWRDLHVGVLDSREGRRADLVDEETFKVEFKE